MERAGASTRLEAQLAVHCQFEGYDDTSAVLERAALIDRTVENCLQWGVLPQQLLRKHPLATPRVLAMTSERLDDIVSRTFGTPPEWEG